MKRKKSIQKWYVFDHTQKYGIFDTYSQAAKFLMSIAEPDDDTYQIALLTEDEFNQYWKEGLFY
jgi:hypothetical protein